MCNVLYSLSFGPLVFSYSAEFYISLVCNIKCSMSLTYISVLLSRYSILLFDFVGSRLELHRSSRLRRLALARNTITETIDLVQSSDSESVENAIEDIMT